MGKKKFFAAAFAAFILWAIVILQTVLTRWYVSQTAFEQAFAKSDIMKASTQEAAADTRNINSDNRVMEGVVNGRLNASEQQTMADKLFRQFGGGEVMNSNSDSSSDYYVAYGFESSKKVNGRRINMMAAFSYDEKEDVTKVVFGTPLINSDF